MACGPPLLVKTKIADRNGLTADALELPSHGKRVIAGAYHAGVRGECEYKPRRAAGRYIGVAGRHFAIGRIAECAAGSGCVRP